MEYEEVLKEATDRFQRIQSDDNENRENYKSDMLFVYSPGNQWPEDTKRQRTLWKEPCLEFNQLSQFVSIVVNDQRENRPGVRIHPASGESSEEVAEIYQGLIRGIEYQSDAESVYDQAFESAVAGNRGAWRVCSEYESDSGFNQNLCIKPISNMLNVYADLNYQQPDGSDRSFVFVTESFPKDEFERKWPDAEPVSWDNLEPGWSNATDQITVADYYRRVCTKRTMVLMSDGASGFKDEMPKPPEGVTVLKEREVDHYTVEWFTIAGGQQVLAKYDWPGQYIPVVIIPGKDLILNGKRCYQGLTRHARDAQSMLNFGMTQQAIHLSLTPRAPYIMAEGQNEGYEQMWKDANTKNWSALMYKPTTIEGVLVPPPQRQQPSMPDAGWERWCQMMIGMIKSTIGMYENSLGQRGQEQSGKAIIAREKQGDTATFNYVDNLARGIALTGKIIVEAVPTFYDTERLVRIVMPDDTQKDVRINQVQPNGVFEAIKTNDVTVGKYAVTVEAGPSYATKRQETAERLTQMVSAFPPLMQVAGDLVVKAQDIPDADVIADRIKLTLPPAIQKAIQAQEQGQQIPPEVLQEIQQKDAQLQEANQIVENMGQKIQELESGAQVKAQAAQAEAQAKAEMHEQDLIAQEIQAQKDADLEVRKAEIAADAKVRVALIDRMTKLDIAELNADQDQLQHEQSLSLQAEQHESGLVSEHIKHEQNLAVQDAHHSDQMDQQERMSAREKDADN